MNKDNKKQTMTKIYKIMDKALDKLIESNAKKYLKPFKNKPWHTIALEGYKNTSKVLLGVLSGHAKKYVKAIEGKKLFNKEKVIKDDDIEDDDIEDDEYEDIDDVLDDILEYEDVVDKDIQNILEEIKEKIIEELELYFEDAIEEELILVAAKEIAMNLGIKFNFNQFDVFTRDYLRNKKINWANQVAETTEKRIKELLVQGFEEGLGSYDIAELIYQDGVFGYNRAEMIARTEIIGNCNYADNTMWGFDENIIGKEWSSTGDGRDRMTHSSASGQKVPKNKPFIIGGYQLMHPGDSSLGAPAGEIINCRCTMFPVFKGESLKSNTIYDEKDVGTVEWLKRREEGFQASYLGDKKKLELFSHDRLKSNELLKPIHEIASNMNEKDGIIKEKIARKIKEVSGVTPFEKIDLFNENRKEYDKRRVFNKNGKVAYDLDLNIHRNLNQHKIAPHIHIWEDGKKEKGYKTPSKEQVENNKDIILKVYDEKYYNSYIEAYKEKDENIKQKALENLTRSWYK